MKMTFLCLLQLAAIARIASAAVVPIDRVEADAWFSSRMDEVVAVGNLGDNSEKCRILGKVVRNFGRKLEIQTDPRWREVFDRAQSLLLEVPGHAEDLAREVETLREGNKSDYDRWREWYLADTLQYLPSPEAIRVLGKYLSDERDPPSTISGDSIYPPGNAMLSAYSLSRIGLRNAPCKAAPAWISLAFDPEFKDCLPLFIEWWGRVESGELSFSFVGQSVSYRFKPDGTWEATPLAISDKTLRDELKPPVPPTSAAKAPPADEPGPSPAPSPRWPWVAAGILVLMAVTAWALRKSKR